jgi:hypothetical protein
VSEKGAQSDTGGARTRAAESVGDSDRLGAAMKTISATAGLLATVTVEATEPGECNASWQTGQNPGSAVSAAVAMPSRETASS